MRSNKKLIIFMIIAIISIGGLAIKGYFDEDKYILTENNTEEISDNEKDYKVNENIEDDEKENTDELSKRKITVYISGEIKKPGVVTLDSDKRLSDAVNILGGVTDKADMDEINLAMKLEDEMHCIIPKKGSKNKSSEAKNSSKEASKDLSKGSSDSSKININEANLTELDTIPGVGEATANKILSYRDEKGGFKNIQEIKNVNGIGDKKFENMKEYICVE